MGRFLVILVLLCHSLLLLLDVSLSLPLCIDSSGFLFLLLTFAFPLSCCFDFVWPYCKWVFLLWLSSVLAFSCMWKKDLLRTCFCVFNWVFFRISHHFEHAFELLSVQWDIMLQLQRRSTATEAIPSHEHLWSWLCFSYQISALLGECHYLICSQSSLCHKCHKRFDFKLISGIVVL